MSMGPGSRVEDREPALRAGGTVRGSQSQVRKFEVQGADTYLDFTLRKLRRLDVVQNLLNLSLGFTGNKERATISEPRPSPHRAPAGVVEREKTEEQHVRVAR